MPKALLVAVVILYATVLMEAQSPPSPPQNAQTSATHETPVNQPIQNPTPSTAPGPANVPQPETFCTVDSREEVKQFCPWLSELIRIASSESKAGKTKDQIANDVGRDLEYLDPATEAGQNAIVDTVTEKALKTAIQSEAQNVLQAANQMTTNQQLGALSNAAGTTSLVSKAGSAAITNLAVDSGALTRSVTGSTVTLTANTDEIFNLVTGTPEYDLNASQSAFGNHILNPLSLMAAFSLNQTSSSATPSNGQASGTTPTSVSNVAIPSGAGKLTAFTAKYEVPNKYDPRSSSFKNAWTKELSKLKPLEIAQADASFNVVNQLETDTTYQTLVKKGISPDCQDSILADAMKADSSALMNDFENQCWQAELGPALQAISPNLLNLVNAYVNAESTLRSAYKAAILDAAGTMFSAQYTFNKPASQPETHDLTVIFDYTSKDRGTLTFNGGVSIYNGTLPPGAKYGRIHYGQVSAEYDRNVNNPTNSYQTQISFAGYWQYQPQPSILNIPAGTVVPGTTIPLTNGTQEFVGTAGSLWVGQAKLTIKGPSGVNIPLAISGSNKTDLLQGTKIGGQLGLSYNFSSLASLFGH